MTLQERLLPAETSRVWRETRGCGGMVQNIMKSSDAGNKLITAENSENKWGERCYVKSRWQRRNQDLRAGRAPPVWNYLGFIFVNIDCITRINFKPSYVIYLYSSGSKSILLDLSPNDDVWVRIIHESDNVHGYDWSSFMGVMISPWKLFNKNRSIPTWIKSFSKKLEIYSSTRNHFKFKLFPGLKPFLFNSKK